MDEPVAKSENCVVVLKAGWTTIGGKTEYREERCEKPVAGERGDFPMCQEHLDLFDPDRVED